MSLLSSPLRLKSTLLERISMMSTGADAAAECFAAGMFREHTTVRHVGLCVMYKKKRSVELRLISCTES